MQGSVMFFPPLLNSLLLCSGWLARYIQEISLLLKPITLTNCMSELSLVC